jgi:GTPase SAR1 family protein
MPNIILLVGASGSGKTCLRGDLLAGLREDLPTMPLT